MQNFVDTEISNRNDGDLDDRLDEIEAHENNAAQKAEEAKEAP